jgi:hypothetical protein
MPGWNQNVLSMEKTSPGPVSKGSTFSSNVKKVGRMDSEFVSFERPTHFSVVDTARGLENRVDFPFTPSDAGVKLSVHLRMEPRGPLRLLEPVLRPAMRRQFAQLPEQVKRGMETARQSHPG